MGRIVIRYKEMVRNASLYGRLSGMRKRVRWKLLRRRASRRPDLKPEEARRIVTACCPKPLGRSYAPVTGAVGKGEKSCDLSIIIPVYQVEKYLRECLASVLSQAPDRLTADGTAGGLKAYSLEVIAVDDGSTDGSGRILEEYAAKGVRVIRQENRGLSGARNTGIENASGKYLMFLDSDDYLEAGCLEQLMGAARESGAQIAAMDYAILAGDRRVEGKSQNGFVTSSYEEMCRVPGFAWGKMMARELFEGIRFPENYWYEDTIVHLILMKRCRKMVFLPVKGYVYRSNETGISYSQKKSLRCMETYWVLEETLRMAQEAGLEPDPPMYCEVLEHLSLTSYQRLKRLEERQKQAVFLLACELAETVRKQAGCENGGVSGRRRIVEKAFLDRDYGIWKLYCECAPVRSEKGA